MIYEKIETDDTANFPIELQFGLKALKEIISDLVTLNKTGVYQLNNKIRFIFQTDKKDLNKADSEVHEKHHDIFYLANGREITIYQGKFDDYDEAINAFGQPKLHDTGFNSEKDIGFASLQTTKESVWNVLDKDHFVHYAPKEFHASQIAMDNKPVQKIVVKILDKKYWQDIVTEETLLLDIQNLKSKIKNEE